MLGYGMDIGVRGKFETGFCSGKETVQLRFTAVLCTLWF